MTILHKLRVDGTLAYLESAPPFVVGTTDTVRLEVTFGSSWDGFARELLVEQMGAELRWKLPIDSAGGTVLPVCLTGAETPFFLWAEGEKDGQFLRTNSVCIAPETLCTGDREEPPAEELLQVYEGPYLLKENGVYPLKDHYLAEDLMVEVPLGADTSEDTVAPAVMLAGYTAHDKNKQPITGEIPTYFCADPIPMDSGEGITLQVGGAYCEEDITVRPVLQSLHVEENGHYVPAAGVVGFSDLTVEIPIGADTSEDTVTPAVMLAGYTAHDKNKQPITGEIPTYFCAEPIPMDSGEGITLQVGGAYCEEDITVRPVLQSLRVEENGHYAPATGYAGIGELAVEVLPRLQAKQVSVNGTVTPDEGYDGLSSVEIQVDAQGITAVSSASGVIVPPVIGIAAVTVVLPVFSGSSSAVGTLE